MKKLLIVLFTLTPLLALSQDVYVTGGYVLDRPTIKDGIKENGYVTTVNGRTEIEKIRQNGFFAGVGAVVKTKKTSTFGLRVEAAFEQHTLHMQRLVTTQEVPFAPQETFQSNISTNNSYLRLSPTISYVKKKDNGMLYQADLGISQIMHLGGWKESSSYTAVLASAGIGYKGFVLKAGTEIGLVNTLGGDGNDYKIYSKRFFAGLNVHFVEVFNLKKKKEATEDVIEIKE